MPGCLSCEGRSCPSSCPESWMLGDSAWAPAPAFLESLVLPLTRVSAVFHRRGKVCPQGTGMRPAYLERPDMQTGDVGGNLMPGFLGPDPSNLPTFLGTYRDFAIHFE
ncbi:unnamed protein product [Rangifer tarandus platyrhynchus]|uniref:Uncharacterized protein n=2 Tax=Rangifer tarandus platyrhynchus TaxID=3082113 RepID=A0AC59ZD69_RANTA|nr:unnamed protein product [Rangifer tarandus platyrhynchus]